MVSIDGGVLSHGGTPSSLDGLFHGKSKTKVDEETSRDQNLEW